MDYNIIKLLNIEDKDIHIIDFFIDGNTKTFVIEKFLKPEFCPACHSKGIYSRSINHPMLQDGFNIKIILRQRKWHCTNPDCGIYFNDQFTFVSSHKQSSNITDFLILKELKNINLTVSDVAKRFNVSDTYVHYLLRQYLNIQRLPLPEILSIDEVHLGIDYNHNYTLVLFDFLTGDIIDLLPNRLEETTNPYFLSIPLEERKNVKYLICNMYNPYINYTKRYFPESIVIIDSFHVVSWLLKLIGQYIKAVKKKYQERDKANYINFLKEHNRINDEETLRKLPVSKEVYLINNFKWLILRNNCTIDYQERPRYNHKLKMYLNTYDYEKMLFDLGNNFKYIRDLKEKYINFNCTLEEDKNKIEADLNKIIEEYSKSKLILFRDFSKLLQKNKERIINSFTYVTDKNGEKRRRSNGPIEGYNRIPKDYKRNARGFENFESVRIRLIWSNRKK